MKAEQLMMLVTSQNKSKAQLIIKSKKSIRITGDTKCITS
jgi:hypothetical protein